MTSRFAGLYLMIKAHASIKTSVVTNMSALFPSKILSMLALARPSIHGACSSLFPRQSEHSGRTSQRGWTWYWWRICHVDTFSAELWIEDGEEQRHNQRRRDEQVPRQVFIVFLKNGECSFHWKCHDNFSCYFNKNILKRRPRLFFASIQPFPPTTLHINLPRESLSH